jgi:hypothetical protein
MPPAPFVTPRKLAEGGEWTADIGELDVRLLETWRWNWSWGGAWMSRAGVGIVSDWL